MEFPGKHYYLLLYDYYFIRLLLIKLLIYDIFHPVNGVKRMTKYQSKQSVCYYHNRTNDSVFTSTQPRQNDGCSHKTLNYGELSSIIIILMMVFIN